MHSHSTNVWQPARVGSSPALAPAWGQSQWPQHIQATAPLHPMQLYTRSSACIDYLLSPELAQSILAFARARLASYKRIRIVEFGELPKTLSGKIRRVELRQRENARQPGEAWPMEFREAEKGD